MAILTPEQLEVLTNIPTEILANYLQRRAEAENLTLAELLEKAGENWDAAHDAADDLLEKGHD